MKCVFLKLFWSASDSDGMLDFCTFQCRVLRLLYKRYHVTFFARQNRNPPDTHSAQVHCGKSDSGD